MTLILDQIPLDLDHHGQDLAIAANEKQPFIRPFLKWAGGKFLVLERILNALPSGQRLVEPFTGSSVVAINSGFPTVLAADANPDLVNLYLWVKSDPDKLLGEIRRLFSGDANTRERFNKNRAEFNTTDDTFRRSALFVYLNRHCFNGLCRYNSRGKFNVPFGKYTNPLLPLDAINSFAAASQNIEFRKADFREVMDSAVVGDVVYCDPPYVPLSVTANFTGYATEGFGPAEQVALAEAAIRLAKRGVPVVISNHDTPWVREIYEGANFQSFGVQRRISRDAATRGAAQELLAIFR